MLFSILWQERLKAGFTKVTSRRVKYFGFLIGFLDGSSMKFLAVIWDHNISHSEKDKQTNVCSSLIRIFYSVQIVVSGYLEIESIDSSVI